MGSKPITAIAKMKSYENSVAKSILDPTDPPKSVEENVKDDQGYLERGAVNFSLGPSQTIITPGETTYGWKGPLDTSGNYYEKLAKEEGFKNFQGTIKEYEQFKLKNMAETGDANVTQQQGESTTTIKPGELLTKFAYKPEVREADTQKIRQGRKIDRNIKRAARVNERTKKKYGEDSAEYRSSNAAYTRLLTQREQGVNPYNTRRAKENIKAPEGTQTKSEFESKFGGNNMGIQEIKSFTPGSINFSTPTIPTSTNTGANFKGAGSYLTQMANDNPKAVGTKRGYKMGGYGTKNK